MLDIAFRNSMFVRVFSSFSMRSSIDSTVDSGEKTERTFGAQILGLDRLSTEGAAERNKAIAPDIAAPLIAAVVKTTGIVKMETIEPMIANKAAFHAALKELHIMLLKPVAA